MQESLPFVACGVLIAENAMVRVMWACKREAKSTIPAIAKEWMQTPKINPTKVAYGNSWKC